jgi:periplasmic protein TonB
MADPIKAPNVPDSMAAGHLSVHLDDSRASDLPFLLDQPRKRMSGAAGASIAGHVVLFIAFLIVIRYAPPPAPVQATATELPKEIVWLAVPGPGGGGGGGGNKMPEPPRKVEAPGKDKLTVPVVKPTEIPKPNPKDLEKPPLELNIPAMTMASGTQTIPGLLEGVRPELSESLGPGSGGGAGTGRGTGMGPGTGSGLGDGSGGGAGGGAYRLGSGIESPRVIREVKPQYTPDAMRAKVQGVVWLECIVNPDGSVGKVDIVKSLDATFGLDQEAVKAIRQWRFVPGTRMGRPVPVIITVELTFTLR